MNERIGSKFANDGPTGEQKYSRFAKIGDPVRVTHGQERGGISKDDVNDLWQLKGRVVSYASGLVKSMKKLLLVEWCDRIAKIASTCPDSYQMQLTSEKRVNIAGLLSSRTLWFGYVLYNNWSQ